MDTARGDGADTAPLTDSQTSVWVAQRLDPLSPGYHETALFRIDGPLDADALEAALIAVAERQPMLRTRFPQPRGEPPHQRVDPVARVAFERVALGGAQGDEEGALRTAVAEHSRRTFDLAAAPPIRWTLFELGPQRHALLRVWHHILGDGLSGRVISDDLSRAYAAISAGRPAALPPLEADYFAYTRRQHDPAFQASLDVHVEAWKARLAGAPTLALPTDFPRPVARTLRGAVVTSRIARGTVDALKTVGRDAKVTPFSMFLAAYATLLSRLSGDSDVVVGMAVAGRPGPEYAEVVGFFAAMAACRIDLAGAPGAIEAGTHVQSRVREAIDHHEVPIEKIVEALGLQREASRQPLFQVAFGMRRTELSDFELEGLDVRRVQSPIGHARYDLTLTMLDAPDGAELHWHYAADLFERATIERMAGQYAELVAAMAREPRRPLATLPLMDEPTRQRVLAGAKGASTAVDGERTVHRRFAAQAAARPDARAIGTMSYAALDEASSRLAAELRARGAGPGAFVAVARERPADVGVAWLAVLKAGAAYVPIDPGLPDERVGHMLADARIAHAIADAGLAPRFARGGIDVLCPEADAARIAAHPARAPDVPVGSEDPAYAIYTSGSSGRPKGVVVPHRAIVGLVCGADYATLGHDDVVAQLAPFAFDASTFELWGPLLNGAAIAPVPKAAALAPRTLASAIRSEGITTLFLTTAVFDAVARDAPAAFAPCRTVMFGGEACDPLRVADVLRAGAPRRLCHVYGPTESTTFATFHEVREVGARAMTIPIGKAIAHAEAYVLREDGELCAPGEPGEIVIGGSGVALGYLGGTEADAKRFVVASVGGQPPQRLYRTGDRARLRDDGTIEFLGRLDGQVKVLGHRIELGEIEAAIARQPGVADVVAVLRGDSSDTRRIVAYVVPSNPLAAPPEGLRRALRGLLPASMLPAEIVWLPSLPLNASGKVDRRALPDMVSTPSEAGIRVGPRDPLEADLVRRWKNLLGKQDLGIFDHFFENGGNSLLAARMVDEIEREMGIAVPLTALFVDDTVDGLARAVREDSLAANSDVVPLNPLGTRPPFVFVHGDFFAGGFHSLTLARLLGPEQPLYAVHPHGVAGGNVPVSIEAMAAERLNALRKVRPHGPYVLCGHCNGAYVAFEIARQLIASGESVPAVIVIDAIAPGKMRTGNEQTLVTSGFAEVGLPPPVDRVSDLAMRLRSAMTAYRTGPIDSHVVFVRSAISNAAFHDEDWKGLGATGETRVLPGDHKSLVMEGGGARFVGVVRDVIDRVAVGAGRVSG